MQKNSPADLTDKTEKEIEPYDYDYWEEYFKEMQIRQAEAM